jgi:membrane-bound lytic murein transglycosylase D
MRETGMENGLKHNWYVDERSDPRKATVAAAKYLQTLDQLFDGNWLLALASYNGGPGRVQRAIKRAGVEDFWKLEAKPGLLPRETREYVPMILAAIIVARSPAEYGFSVAPGHAVICDTVTLPEPVDLRHVAEWTGSSVEEIQALNPELRRWTTPVQSTNYQLRVPQGTGDLVRAKLQDAVASDVRLASLQWYTVRRGDTLLRIARRLHVSREDLADANYLSTRARLTSGQRLIVPRESTALLAARTADDDAPPVAAAATTSRQTRSRVVYRVKPGDTLYRIAQSFHTTVDELKRWNKIRGTRLGVGDRLTVYTVPSEAANGGGN